MKKQAKSTKLQIKSGNAVLTETPVPKRDNSREADQHFPIVGIGASKSRLEAGHYDKG